MVIRHLPLCILAPCVTICSTVIASTATADAVPAQATTTEQPAWTISTPFDWVNSVFTKSTEDYGITPSLAYEATFQGNATGGNSRSVAYAHNIEFGLEFDLNKIAGIQGASITISGVNAAGRNLSAANYINNTFTVSEAFVGHGTYLYELYWQQQLEDDSITLRLGRINSSNFAALPAFGLQTSGGINGNPTSLFLNSNFQSMPNAVWGADVNVQLPDDYSIYTGVYQATNLPGNQHGTDFSYRSGDRLLVMTQLSWTPTFGQETTADGKTTPGYSGTYMVGAYYSNLPQQDFNSADTITNTVGIYLMAQQTVWYNETNPNETFDVWGGFSYSPQGKVAQMEWMGFTGFVWTGIIPGRDQDQFLGTMMVGTFSNEYADSVQTAQTGRPTYEMVFELSYVYNINSYAFIQPDIQYVIRPNGVKSTQDALVLGMQFGVTF